MCQSKPVCIIMMRFWESVSRDEKGLHQCKGIHPLGNDNFCGSKGKLVWTRPKKKKGHPEKLAGTCNLCTMINLATKTTGHTICFTKGCARLGDSFDQFTPGPGKTSCHCDPTRALQQRLGVWQGASERGPSIQPLKKLRLKNNLSSLIVGFLDEPLSFS